MSTSPPSRSHDETGLLARIFHAHGVLSLAQIEFLRERGFLTREATVNFDEYPGEYNDSHDSHDAEDRTPVPPPTRTTNRSRRRHRSGDWTLAQLGDYLGTRLEFHATRLLALCHLAPEGDSWSETLAHLRQLDGTELTRRLAHALDAEHLTLGQLWDALTLDEFRQPVPEASGPAYRAYRAAVQAADCAQIPGSYTHVLSREEVGLVYQVVRLQRSLLRSVGRVWLDQPSLIARCLRRGPHRLALLALLLLYNSRPLGSAGRWAAREEAFESLTPTDHPTDFHAAWLLAVQMDADTVLPYLVDASTSQPLLCPSGWNELGYRVREKSA